jgi:hypothetical protein
MQRVGGLHGEGGWQDRLGAAVGVECSAFVEGLKHVAITGMQRVGAYKVRPAGTLGWDSGVC